MYSKVSLKLNFKVALTELTTNMRWRIGTPHRGISIHNSAVELGILSQMGSVQVIITYVQVIIMCVQVIVTCAQIIITCVQVVISYQSHVCK